MKGPPLTLFELLWLLFPPLFVIFSFYLQPLQITKKAAHSEQLMSGATWEVSKSGIQITSSSGSNFLDWESLSKLVITKDYYLLASKNKITLSAFSLEEHLLLTRRKRILLSWSGKRSQGLRNQGFIPNLCIHAKYLLT